MSEGNEPYDAILRIQLPPGRRRGLPTGRTRRLGGSAVRAGRRRCPGRTDDGHLIVDVGGHPLCAVRHAQFDGCGTDVPRTVDDSAHHATLAGLQRNRIDVGDVGEFTTSGLGVDAHRGLEAVVDDEERDALVRGGDGFLAQLAPVVMNISRNPPELNPSIASDTLQI